MTGPKSFMEAGRRGPSAEAVYGFLPRRGNRLAKGRLLERLPDSRGVSPFLARTRAEGTFLSRLRKPGMVAVGGVPVQFALPRLVDIVPSPRPDV